MGNEDDSEKLSTEEECEEMVGRLDRLFKASPTASASYSPHVVSEAFSDLIGEQYELGDCIGSGSFGQVYRAVDTLSQSQVAIKLPRIEVLLASQQFERFRREAEIAKELDHEDIVPVLDCSFDSVVPFIVMRWCKGIDLGQFLNDFVSPDNPVCWREAARAVSRIARALDHAHQRGITHRDMKPSNILLELAPDFGDDEALPEKLGQYQPRVTDFGLAHFVDISVADTRSSVLIGTPMYLAPEQIERCVGTAKGTSVSHSSDIYALGMILFEILAGRTCYDGSSWFSVIDSIRSGRRLALQKIRPDLPPSLASICECCLSRDPVGRYSSALDLADALDACEAGKLTKVPKRTWRQRLQYFSRQPKRVEQAGSFALLIQAVVVLSIFGTALAKSAGLPFRIEKSTVQFWLEIISLTLFVHLPIGWVALKTLRGSYVAVYAGFIASIFLLLSQLALVAAIAFDWWPFGFVPLYADEPGTSRVVYIIMMVVFGIQLTLFGLAIPAGRRFLR